MRKMKGILLISLLIYLTEMVMRLPEFKERGVPEHLSIIGIIPEDRITLCNYASAEYILGKKRRFLEAEWPADSTEYLRNIVVPTSTDGFQCHLRISYEILPNILNPVVTLYHHSGMEF